MLRKNQVTLPLLTKLDWLVAIYAIVTFLVVMKGFYNTFFTKSFWLFVYIPITTVVLVWLVRRPVLEKLSNLPHLLLFIIISLSFFLLPTWKSIYGKYKYDGCIVVWGCRDLQAEMDEKMRNAKPNVKFSSFKKDGSTYFSYDFIKATFTVNATKDINHSDESTIDFRWFWPGFVSVHADNVPKKGERTTILGRANFSEYGRDQDIYTNWQKRIKRSGDDYKLTEVDSDVQGLRKFRSTANIIYMPKDENIKTPQGTPLVFWCFEEKHPPQLTCEMVFQYYEQVSTHVEFAGNIVLPKWEEFITKFNYFFKSRMQEK